MIILYFDLNEPFSIHDSRVFFSLGCRSAKFNSRQNFFPWGRIWQCLCVSLCVHIKLWGSLENPKMLVFGWNLVHLLLG